MSSCSSEVKRLRRDPLAQWKRMMENNIECLESSRNIYTEGNRHRSAKCSCACLREKVDCLERPLYDARHPNMDKRQICDLSEKLDSCESLKQGDTHCRITRHDVPSQNYNIIADTEDSKKITMDNQKGTRFYNSETLALCVQSLTLGSNKGVCDEDIHKSLHTLNIKNTVCHKIDMETDVKERQNFLNKRETIYPTDKIIDAYCPHLCNDDFVCDTHFYSNPIGNIESDGANIYTQNTEYMGSHECATFSRGARMFTVDKHKEVDRIFKHGKYLPSKQNRIKSTNTGCKTHSCFQGGIYIDNGQNILSTGKDGETYDHCFLNIGDIDIKQSMCNTDKDPQSYNNGGEGQITPKTGTDCTTNNNLANAQSSLSLCKSCKTNNNVEDCKSDNNVENCKTYNNVEDCKTDNNVENCKTDNNVEDCKTNNNAEDCKTNNNAEDCKTHNNVEDCKTNNNVEDCKTDNNVEDCKTNNNAEDCKTNNNVEDCKTDNNVEICKTNNNVEDCKTGNNVEICKTNNNVEDCKTGNNADNAYSPFNAWKDCKTQNARDVNNGQSMLNGKKAGTQESRKDEKLDFGRCLMTTDQNRFDVNRDSSAKFRNAYDNQNITNKLEYAISSSKRILSDERKVLEIPQTCANVDFDLCSEDIDGHTTDDFSDLNGIKEHVNICPKEISDMTSEVDCLQDTVKHTKYTIACKLSSCDITTSAILDNKINPVKERCGTLIPHILKSEFTNTADRTHKNKCITNPDSITSVYDNTSLTNSLHKTDANNSVINCCSESSLIKKSVGISRSMCTLILPNVLHKSHRQKRAYRSRSLENIVEDDMKRSQTCQINNINHVVKNWIPYTNIRCSKDEHISSVCREVVLSDHLTAEYTKNCKRLKQKSLEQISQNFSLSPALNRKQIMLDYKQKSDKTLKNLTRNPMTQWTRLVNDNIEAVFRTQSDPQHGFKNFEASNLNKTEHPHRSQNLNTEEIKSGRAEFANVQIKSQKQFFKNNCSSESSGINSSKNMFKMYGLHDSLKTFEEKDSTDCREIDSTCFRVKCHAMEANSLSMNILEQSKLEISEPLGTDDQHCYSYCNDCKDSYHHEKENSDLYDKKDDKIMSDEKCGNVYENHETAAKQDVDMVTTLSSAQCNNNDTAVVFIHNSVHETEPIKASKDIIKKHTNIIFLEEGKEDTKNIRVCKKHEQYSEDKCVQIEECVECGFRHNDKVEGDCRDKDIYSLDCHHDNRTEMIVGEERVQNMHTSKTEDCEVDLTKLEGRDSEVAWTKFGGGDCEVHWKEFVGVDSEGDRTHFGDRDCVVDWTKLGGGDCEIDRTDFKRRYCEVDRTKFGGGNWEVDGIEFGGRDSRADHTQFGEGDCKGDKKKLVEDNWEYLQTSHCLKTENNNYECYDFIISLRQDDCSTEKEKVAVDSGNGNGRKNYNGRECNISKFIHSEMSEKQCTYKERNSRVMNDSDSYARTEVSAQNITDTEITNVSESLSTTVASQDDSMKCGTSYKNTSYDKCMTNCVIEASEKVKTNECETNIFPGVTVSEFDCHNDEIDVDIAADTLGIRGAKEYAHIPAKNQFMRQCPNICQQDTTINTRDKIDTQIFSCGIPAYENLQNRNSGKLANYSSILDVSGSTETYSNFSDVEKHIVTSIQHSDSVASLHVNAASGERTDETTNSLVQSVSRIIETSRNLSNEEENIVTCTQHSGSVAPVHDDNMGETADKTKAYKPVIELSCGNNSYKNQTFVNRNVRILSLLDFQHSTRRDNELYESTSADNLATRNACRLHVHRVWTVKPNNVRSKSDTEIRSATNRKCVTENGSATNMLFDTEVGRVNKKKSNTQIRLANTRKSDTGNRKANSNTFDTVIKSAGNGMSDNEISYDNSGKFGTQIRYINSVRSETEIVCADNEMYDTEIRSVNNGTSYTENGSTNNDKSDTEFKIANNDKSYTQIRSVNNRKCDTEISCAIFRKCDTDIRDVNKGKCDADIRDVNKGKCDADIRDVNKGKCNTDIRDVNKGKCDTDIRDVNKGKCDADITCESGKIHAEISCSDKGISSVRIKCADDDEQCLKPIVERLGHVRKDRYDEKDNHGLLQFVEKAATEMTQLNTSQIKEDKADHMEESKRTVKDLTRNPVTQWTRLVNANIEAMVRKKADTTDTKWYGSSTYEPCRFSKRGSLQTTQHVSIENIQSESLDINTVHFKHDGYCFEPVHIKECSELLNKNMCSFPTITGSLNSQEFNTACLKTVSGAVVNTDGDNNIDIKYKNMNMTVSQKINPEKLEVAERAEWQWYSINVGSTGCSFNQDCTESHHYESGMNTMYAQQEVKGTVDENCGCVISENMIVNKVPLSVSQYTNISGETIFSTKPVCETVCVEKTNDTKQEDNNIPYMKTRTRYSEDSSIGNVLRKQCDHFNGKSKNEPNHDKVCSQDFTNRRISDVSESLKINGPAIICGLRDSTDGCGIVCNDKCRESKITYISTSNETIHTKQPDTVQVRQKDISDCELNSCFKNSDFEMKCMPSKNEAAKRVSMFSDKEINMEGEVINATCKSETQVLSDDITIHLEETFNKEKGVNTTCKSETQVLSDDITIHLEENLNKEKVVNVTCKSETQVLSDDITIHLEENLNKEKVVNVTCKSETQVLSDDITIHLEKNLNKEKVVNATCKSETQVLSDDITIHLEKNLNKEKVVNATCKSETQVLSDDITIHLEENFNKEKVVHTACQSETQMLSNDITVSHEENQTLKMRTKTVMPFIINSIARANKGSDNKNTVNYTQQSCNNVSLLDGIGTKYKYIDKRENHCSKVIHCENALSKKNSFIISRSDHTLLLPTFSRSVFKENRLYQCTSADNCVTYDKHKTGRCLLKIMKHKKLNRMSKIGIKGAETDSSIDTFKVELSGDGCRPGCIAEDKTTSLQGLQKTTANVNHLHSLNSKDSERKNFIVHTKESFSEKKNCIVLTHESLSEGKNYMVHIEKSLSEGKKSLSEGKNYMVHTEKSLSEGDNNMVHTEKSLSEEDNNMVHTEKSLFERKNMVHTEKSLSEGDNNMVHTEKSLSEGYNNMVHTEKSLSKGDNNMVHTEKSLFERKISVMHTEEPPPEGRNFIVHTDESYKPLKHLTRNHVTRTLKQLTRNPMTQWTRLVNNNIEAVSKRRLGESELSKCCGGDFEADIFGKSKNYIFPERVLGTVFNESEFAESALEKLYLSEPESAKSATDKFLSESESATSSTEKLLSESESATSSPEKHLRESESATSSTEKHLSESESVKSGTEKYLNELESAENKTELYFSEPESAKRGRERIYLSESDSAKSGTDTYLNESESAKRGKEMVYLSESESAKCAKKKLYLREPDSAKLGTEKLNLSTSDSARSATDESFLNSNDTASVQEVDVMSRISNTCADCVEETPKEKVKSLSSYVCLCEQTKAVEPLHLVNEKHLLLSKILSAQNRTADGTLAETETCCTKNTLSRFDSVSFCEVMATVNPIPGCVQYVTCKSDNPETDSPLWQISSGRTDAELQCISISQRQIQQKCILNQFSSVNLARPMWYSKRPLKTVDVTVYVHKSKGLDRLSSTKKILNCDEVYSRGKIKHLENNYRTDKSKNQDNIFSRDRQKYPSTDKSKVQNTISCTDKRKYQENISRTDKNEKMAGLHSSKEKDIVSSKDRNILKLGTSAQISENYDRISSNLSTRHAQCSATTQGRASEVLDELSCENTSTNSGWSRFWYFMAHMFTGFSKPLPHQNDVENKQMGQKLKNSDHKQKVHCFQGKWRHKYNESGASLFNITSLHNKKHMLENSICIRNDSDSKKHKKQKVITGIDLITGEGSPGVTEYDKTTARSKVKLSQEKKSSSGTDWREPTENILFRDQVEYPWSETDYLSEDKNIEKCSYVLVPQDHSNSDTQVRQTHDKSECQTVPSGNTNTFTDNKEFSGLGKCKQDLHKSQIPVFASRFSKSMMSDLDNGKITRRYHQEEADSCENRGQNKNETTVKHHNLLETEIFELLKENKESEHNYFSACQTSADKTFNVSVARSADTTALWKEFSLCHSTSERDGSLHEMGAAETDGSLPVRTPASIKKDNSIIIQFLDSSARIRNKFSINNTQSMSVIGKTESEQEHLYLRQKSENQTCNICMDESEDKTAIFDKYYQCENKSEDDATLHEIGLLETVSKYSILPVKKSASIEDDSSNIIQFLDTPARIKEKASINTESVLDDEHLGDYFQSLVTLNQKVAADIGPDLGQHGQGCSRDECCDLTESQLLQSSLECLLEMLLQRGKVTLAFITNIEGEVLAKTARCSVTAQDINSILFSLFSSYRGMMKITVFSDVYTCFKQDEHSLVGQASTNIFVARRGQQSIVVGFCDALTPGSCVKEVQEISELLNKRGL